jgi:hypothetical protein
VRPADRLSRLALVLTVENGRFVWWDRYATEYGDVDIGRVLDEAKAFLTWARRVTWPGSEARLGCSRLTLSDDNSPLTGGDMGRLSYGIAKLNY